MKATELKTEQELSKLSKADIQKYFAAMTKKQLIAASNTLNNVGLWVYALSEAEKRGL